GGSTALREKTGHPAAAATRTSTRAAATHAEAVTTGPPRARTSGTGPTSSTPGANDCAPARSPARHGRATHSRVRPTPGHGPRRLPRDPRRTEERDVPGR